ncbi:hypothetical protein DXG03_006490 [Asterophora parasitica]|uniref:SURP motif domain-containing protein n=1 Tax=Asterophora parasitica TaxID=117018 RepID=A0A9P7KEW6_9AGAR|nr:hypothetical protein DXG03_006490 [Asterophora parasitica]
MSSSRKRKARSGDGFGSQDQGHVSSNNYTAPESNASVDPSPISALYIQAYEADIVRGPRSSLSTIGRKNPRIDDRNSKSTFTGDALIQWAGQVGARPAFPQEDQDDEAFGQVKKAGDQDTYARANAIWMDRYDVRLLLDTLSAEEPVRPYEATPDSPGGWSDLPSDNEDVFFFSPEELEDYRRDKKRRHIDQVREERLKARCAEDGASEEVDEMWGGSDEEPDDPQRELMRRTATHLLTSPNPAQLEMRILANHGGDHRFAFFRGRWSRAWLLLKAKVKLDQEEEMRQKNGTAGLGVLAGYGDSDDDGSDAEEKDESEKAAAVETAEPDAPPPPFSGPLHEDGDDAAKQARRVRAKKWTERQRILNT